MNDEIKEIIDNFKKYEARYKLYNETQFIITHREVQILLNYITNLQQENERLKEKSINEVLKNDFDMCVKDLKKANKKIEKLEDYKSRCEKAVEYIKEDYERNQEVIEYCGFDGFYKKLLNILNGKE